MKIFLPLTDRQAKVYNFIISFLKENKYPPIIKEIQNELKLPNSGSVSCALRALEKKKYIYRTLKNSPRGVRLTNDEDM